MDQTFERRTVNILNRLWVIRFVVVIDCILNTLSKLIQVDYICNFTISVITAVEMLLITEPEMGEPKNYIEITLNYF